MGMGRVCVCCALCGVGVGVIVFVFVSSFMVMFKLVGVGFGVGVGVGGAGFLLISHAHTLLQGTGALSWFVGILLCVAGPASARVCVLHICCLFGIGMTALLMCGRVCLCVSTSAAGSVRVRV